MIAIPPSFPPVLKSRIIGCSSLNTVFISQRIFFSFLIFQPSLFLTQDFLPVYFKKSHVFYCGPTYMRYRIDGTYYVSFLLTKLNVWTHTFYAHVLNIFLRKQAINVRVFFIFFNLYFRKYCVQLFIPCRNLRGILIFYNSVQLILDYVAAQESEEI